LFDNAAICSRSAGIEGSDENAQAKIVYEDAHQHRKSRNSGRHKRRRELLGGGHSSLIVSGSNLSQKTDGIRAALALPDLHARDGDRQAFGSGAENPRKLATIAD
jgi:hypothetical protein